MNTIKTILMAGAAVMLVAGPALGAGTTYFVPASSASKTAKPKPPPPPSAAAVKLKAMQELLERAKSPPISMNAAQLKNLTQQVAAQQKIVDAEPKLFALALPLGAGGDDAGTAQAPGGTTTTAIPDSKSNYKRDQLSWHKPVHVFPRKADGGLDLSRPICYPAGKTLVGDDSEMVKASLSQTDDNNQQTKTDADNYVPVWSQDPVNTYYQADDDDWCPTHPKVPPKPVVIATDMPLGLAETDAKKGERWGLDFGTLVVPFKFELSDKKAVTSSATLGGYLGYRLPWDIAGIEFRPVVFAGVSEVPTSGPDGHGGTSSQTVAGLSYGVGLLTTVKDTFNIGLVFGADHVDSVQDYKYQDQPWVSLSLGVSFTE